MNAQPPLPPLPEEAPDLFEGADVGPSVRLRAVCEELHELRVALVCAYVEARMTGDTLAVEGVPLDEMLRSVGGLSWREVSALDVVFSRVRELGGCWVAFQRRLLTFDEFEQVCRTASVVHGEYDLGELDRVVAAAAERSGSHAVSVCRRVVRETLGALEAANVEDQRLGQDRFVAQPSLLGGGRFEGSYGDDEAFATVLQAVAGHAPTPQRGVTEAERLAAGLLELARSSGGDGGGARSMVVAHLDLETATAVQAGTWVWPWATSAPGLTATLADVLACNAELIVALTDGYRPLATLKGQRTLPESTRRIVLDRDRGCRWPGCDSMVVEVHHLVWLRRGGDHHPDNFVSLCRRHHRSVHRHGWRIRLDLDDGWVTVERDDAGGGTVTLRGPPRAPVFEQPRLQALEPV